MSEKIEKRYIPKLIHYCWFGGNKLPKLAAQCMGSWKKYCPDYKIMRWDETNFDINSNLYVKQAYENKKYAFVSDYVRLWALYNYGGVYMDIDVEVIKNLDKFLSCGMFSGFESEKWVPTGIMGSTPNHQLISSLLAEYEQLKFLRADSSIDLTTNTVRITRFMTKNYNLILNGKYQILANDTYIYPKDYFNPMLSRDKVIITTNTHTIHYFLGSWGSVGDKIQSRISYLFFRIIGIELYDRIKMHFHVEHGKQILSKVMKRKIIKEIH